MPPIAGSSRRRSRTSNGVTACGRSGFWPTAATDSKNDIKHLHGSESGGIEVFCPLPGSKGKPGDPAPKRGDGPGVIAWRERMASEAGMTFYRKRFATERPRADMRNRGLTRLVVRGIKKVQAVGLWYVLAYNFMQRRFLVAKAAQLQSAAI